MTIEGGSSFLFLNVSFNRQVPIINADNLGPVVSVLITVEHLNPRVPGFSIEFSAGTPGNGVLLSFRALH